MFVYMCSCVYNEGISDDGENNESDLNLGDVHVTGKGGMVLLFCTWTCCSCQFLSLLWSHLTNRDLIIPSSISTRSGRPSTASAAVQFDLLMPKNGTASTDKPRRILHFILSLEQDCSAIGKKEVFRLEDHRQVLLALS